MRSFRVGLVCLVILSFVASFAGKAGTNIDLMADTLPDPSELTDAEIAGLCFARSMIQELLVMRQHGVNYLDFLIDYRDDLDASMAAIDTGGVAAGIILAIIPEPTTTVAGISIAKLSLAGDVALWVIARATGVSLEEWLDSEIDAIARDNSKNVYGDVYRSIVHDAVLNPAGWFAPFTAIASLVAEFFDNATLTGDTIFIPRSTTNYLDRVVYEQLRREQEPEEEDACVFLEELGALCYEFRRLDAALYATYGPPWSNSKYRSIIRQNKSLLAAIKAIRDLLDDSSEYPNLKSEMSRAYSAFRRSPYTEHAELWLDGLIDEGNAAFAERNEALGKVFDAVDNIEDMIRRTCPSIRIHR